MLGVWVKKGLCVVCGRWVGVCGVFGWVSRRVYVVCVCGVMWCVCASGVWSGMCVVCLVRVICVVCGECIVCMGLCGCVCAVCELCCVYGM